MKARISLFFVLLLALPLTGFSQSSLNFPRLYTVADLGSTGFAAVNPSSTAATLTFTLYSATGASLATSPQSIPARAQISLLGNQLFPSASAPGWVQAVSTTTGLQGFWLGGDFANIMDGAEAAPVGTEFIFPLATSTTELNVANISGTTNTLTIRIYGTAGTELATAITPTALGANGIYKSTLAAAFPTVNFTNAMYVKVTGTGTITGTSVAVDFIYAPSWSVVNGIDTTSTVIEANFPHVPSGPEDGSDKWNGIIGITNLSSVAQTLTLTYNRSTGSPVTTTRSLAGNGSLRESVKDVFSFGNPAEDGWVKVTGTAPLGGYIAYGYSGTQGVAVVPVQALPQTQLMFSHVANGSFWGTGLALLNTTTTDAIVEVYIMRRAGTIVGGASDVLTATFSVAAGKKVAKLLNELVPSSTFDDGFVYVKSANNVPLYAFQLFFSRDLKIVANVAAGAIDPSISYSPPAAAVPLLPLTITTLTPSTAVLQATISVIGTGFNTTAASNTVVFTSATGSVTATAATATATTLTVVVPATAISGPVYVTTGGRFSNSAVLAVNATSSTTVTSSVTVTASQNTIADIYVTAPAGTTALNATALALTDTSVGSTLTGPSSVQVGTNVTRRLWIQGDGISVANGTTVTISGTGITVATIGGTTDGQIVVHITVPTGTTLGPRNIILTNSNLDTSIVTGGLIVQ